MDSVMGVGAERGARAGIVNGTRVAGPAPDPAPGSVTHSRSRAHTREKRSPRGARASEKSQQEKDETGRHRGAYLLSATPPGEAGGA